MEYFCCIIFIFNTERFRIKEVVVSIPTFNNEQTVEETLISLLNQSYPINKITIFDNASNDRTIEIIKKYSDKNFIEIFTNATNIGAEGNFTKCIENASGDYHLIAHSDDVYEKDFIKILVEAMERNPSAVASFTQARLIGENGLSLGMRFYPKELKKKPETLLTFNDFFKLVLKYSNFVTCPGVLIRTKILKSKIIIWNGKDFKSSADLDVWLRLSEFGPLLALNSPLIRYRESNASFSFMLAKKRTTQHDFFKVLDFYTNKYSKVIMKEDLIAINFLEIKDKALIALNKMRAREKLNENDEIKVSLKLIIWAIIISDWHRNFLIKILGIKAIAFFYKSILGQKIEK